MNNKNKLNKYLDGIIRKKEADSDVDNQDGPYRFTIDIAAHKDGTIDLSFANLDQEQALYLLEAALDMDEFIGDCDCDDENGVY